MSKLDLEKMQGAWRLHSQRVEASLSLDVAGVRNRLKLGTQSAFKRHLRWLGAEIVFGAATLIALLVFIVSHRSDVVYLAAALPLLAMVLFAVATDIRHWQILSTLNLSAPITQVRAIVDAVRARRLLVVKWIALSSCLLWLPLVAVLFKAAFAVDLLHGLHFSVVAVNIVLGVLLIPIGLVVFGWFTKRFAHAPAFQRFIDDAAGTSFSAARASFESEANFESGLLSSDAPTALAYLEQRQWPAHADALLQRFRKSLMFGIFLPALFVLGMVSFNAVHGGDVHALIPGIFLHLFFVMQMVAGIVHRQLLRNLGASSALPLEAQVRTLKQVAYWRGNVARLSIVLSPLVALALVQVFAHLIYAIDLYALANTTVKIITGLVLLSACVLITFAWRAKAMTFAPSFSNALALGALKRNQQLLAALTDKVF